MIIHPSEVVQTSRPNFDIQITHIKLYSSFLVWCYKFKHTLFTYIGILLYKYVKYLFRYIFFKHEKKNHSEDIILLEEKN